MRMGGTSMWDKHNAGAVGRACVLAFAALSMLLMAAPPLDARTDSSGNTSETVAIVTDSRIAGDNRRTRFVMDLSHSVQIRAFTLGRPYRVVIDLPEVSFTLPEGKGETGRGLISAYRYGRIGPEKSRIVLDADRPVLIDRAFVRDPEAGQPARLVVDLIETDAGTFQQRLAVANTATSWPRSNTRAKEGRIPPDAREPLAQRPVIERPMVVVDPGHGGIDPGAISPRGTKEKDLALQFSKLLGEKLAETGVVDVHLTRDTDTFIPLAERVRIARDEDATLFISIHADSFRQGHVRGATVYTLSERASDAEAAAIAARENESDILAGIDIETENDAVSSILFDLVRRETKNLSILFAKTLVDSMRSATALNKNPHRFAGFKVLRAPDVPSVLLELGYLSNQKDESRMMSPEWQNKTAGAIVEAMLGYLRAQEQLPIQASVQTSRSETGIQ